MTAPTKRTRAAKCKNCGEALVTEFVVRERRYLTRTWRTMARRHCRRCAVNLARIHGKVSPHFEYVSVEVPRG